MSRLYLTPHSAARLASPSLTPSPVSTSRPSSGSTPSASSATPSPTTTPPSPKPTSPSSSTNSTPPSNTLFPPTSTHHRCPISLRFSAATEKSIEQV
ncbi:hypothetical protein U1Q18_036786 [Sarracenia purpurea var. burkii]